MAVDLLGFSKMDEQIAIQEAASAGLRSMEHLIRVLSQQQQQQQKLNPQPPSSHNSVHNLDCREITDITVSKFKKVNSILNRTGHARFRRGPSPSSSSSSSFQQQQQQHVEKLSDHPNRNNSSHHSTLNHHQQQPQPVSISPPPQSQTLTLDFTKPNFMTPNPTHSEVSTSQFTKDSSFSISPPMSSNTSSFLSSITADGSVSNGKQGSSMFVAPAPTISAGKPPLSSSYRKKCHEHGHSDSVSVKYSESVGRCHCSKRRKSRVKKIVRVPAISSKMADIPADEHSWRKYGQKPIKGSPYPRGYYKCSTVRGCPARKHVERDQNDPTMLIVTHEGEHRHSQPPPPPPVVGESTVHGGGSVGLMVFESS